MKNIRICVIGAGRWGINHINTLLELGVLGGVVDIDFEKIKNIRENYPKVIFFDNVDDAIGSIYHSIITESLSGPVNVASPNCVQQGEWASTLAKVIWGPFGKLTTLLPIPAFVLRGILGEFGDVLALSSIRADSSKLTDSGYKFRFENLEKTFRHVLGMRKAEDLQ